MPHNHRLPPSGRGEAVTPADVSALLERVARLEAAVFGAGRAVTRSDRLADYVIRHESKTWTGPTAIGQWYSTAPLAWLTYHAEECERRASWRAKQDDERVRERATWDLRTARRMRAWLARRAKELTP